jgi:hypothetical protein
VKSEISFHFSLLLFYLNHNLLFVKAQLKTLMAKHHYVKGLFLFAALIGYCAGSLACRLARSLTFTATAFFQAVF